MSEFTTDTFPNDDTFNVGENLLYSEEDFLPALGLLSYISDETPEKTTQFMHDFRTQANSGNYTLQGAYQNLQDPSFAHRIPKSDFLPLCEFTNDQYMRWSQITSGLTWANVVAQVDSIAGPDHELVTHRTIHDPKSPSYIGPRATEKTADLAAFREQIAQQGGLATVVLSIEKMQQELQAQLDWAYVVSSINALTGYGIFGQRVQKTEAFYVDAAQEALKVFDIPESGERLTHIERLKQRVAQPLAQLKKDASMPNQLIGHSQTILKKSTAIDGESRYVDRVRATALRALAEEKEQQIETQKVQRAGELQQSYAQHITQHIPPLSGKVRKREGYEPFWNALIGRGGNVTGVTLLDHDAAGVLSALHMLRTTVASSFDGVHEAHEWQQDVRIFEQTLVDEYRTLNRIKELSLKDGVTARLDWLRENWEMVAGQLRNITDFPVNRVAAALFPEMAPTIQAQEQKAEKRTATVVRRLGSEALDQLIVNEVDWEILPVEHVGERIQQEAERMTRGKQRSESGRRAVQDVRVRDLVELSTLFDDAVVHVSREKDGITRRKNEPYFVITFTYGGQHFALAENLVLDNATFILPESEFSWQDVFSLPRGAVGEFGARRINHPPVDETGEYEGGSNTHVNAIFAKLDKALAAQQ